ncbi:MAG: hypothetical protein ACR2I3_01200 [Rhodococcus sp. (in: high G+C Gram-positive bacteria)]
MPFITIPGRPPDGEFKPIPHYKPPLTPEALASLGKSSIRGKSVVTVP